MIMFRLVNRLLRSAIATARRILEGLSCMAPNPAFCAASDIVSGDGDAENLADSWRPGDVEKPAERGLTKFPMAGEGEANPKAPGDIDMPGEGSDMEARGDVPIVILARGGGEASLMLPRGEGEGKPKLLRGERSEALGDGDAKDMLPKGRDATGSAYRVPPDVSGSLSPDPTLV